MKATPALTILSLAFTALASADVTITSSVTGRSGKAPGEPASLHPVDAEGTTVSFYKGEKLRIDVTSRGAMRTTIVDLAAKTVVEVDHATRSATRHALVVESANAMPNTTGVILTPTGKTRMLLDQSSQDYAWSVAFVDFEAASGAMRKTRMTMSGTAWIATDSVASSSYSAFYAAAAERHLPFFAPGPRRDRGVAAAIASRDLALAARGVPYALDTAIAFEDIATDDTVLDRQPVPPGAPKGQLRKGGTSSMVVTKVSNDPIADTTFEIPAGYAVTPATRR